ncbi:ABC transporter substrate-binding protein [soil metagenome]
MRMSRTTLPILLLLAVIAAACSDSNFDNGDTASTGGSSLQLAGFASSQSEDDALRAILANYEGGTVAFNPSPDYDTTLQAALAGGQPPDVFYVNDNRVPDLAEAGVLAPLEGNVSESDDFYPALQEAFSYDGEFYCPPKDFSTLALQYNVDMFEEAGIEPPTTWEEFEAAAEALTTGDQVGLALAPEFFRWGVFAVQAGGELANADRTAMTATDEAMVEGMSFVANLYEQGWAETPAELDAGWAGEAFGQGKAAMTIEGNWIVPALRNDFPDINWAVAELPAGPAGQGTFAFSVCYAVAVNAADTGASWDLVDYLVSPEQQIAFTQQFPVMPSRESLRDDWLEANPDLDAHLSGAEYAVAPVYVPGFQAVLDTINDGIQGIADGSRSVEEVLEATQTAGDAVLG